MKKSLLTLTLGLGVFSMTSQAALLIEDYQESPKVKVEQVKTYTKSSNFKNVGKVIKYKNVNGFASDMPLKASLEQIIPNNWKVAKKGNVDMGMLVSWKGGESFDKIIRKMGEDKFSTVINWNEKVIILMPLKEVEIKKEVKTAKTVKTAHKVIKESHSKPIQKFVRDVKFTVKSDLTGNFTQDDKTIKSSMKNTSKYTKAKPKEKVKQKSWLLSKKYTLKENMNMWAKRGGWTLVWDAPDYHVLADTKLYGELDSENGPIVSILKLYEDATLPLKVDILGGNKVISVKGKNYYTNGINLGK